MFKHAAITTACAAAGIAAGLIAPHVYQPWADGHDPIRVHAASQPAPVPAGGMKDASHSVTLSEDGEPVLTAAQRQALMDRHNALIAALPNYGKEAPKGCYEDMVCWIGSAHDGRDDDSIIADLPGDIEAAQVAYPDEGTGWDHVTQQYADALAEGLGDGDDTRDWESCWIRVADTTVVVCPDGTVVTS